MKQFTKIEKNIEEVRESESSIQQVYTTQDVEQEIKEKKEKRSLLSVVKNFNLIRLIKEHPVCTVTVVLMLIIGGAKEAYIRLNPNRNLTTNIQGTTYYNLSEAMNQNIVKAYKFNGIEYTEMNYDELNDGIEYGRYVLELTNRNYGWVGAELLKDNKDLVISPIESPNGEEKALEEVDEDVYCHDGYEVDIAVQILNFKKLNKMLSEKDSKILCDYDSYTYADGSSIVFQGKYSVFKGIDGYICPMSDDGEEVSRYNQGYVVWKSYDKVDRVMLHDGTLVQWYQISDGEPYGHKIYKYITSDGVTYNIEMTLDGRVVSYETADGKTILPLTTVGICKVDWLNEKGEKIGYKTYYSDSVTWTDLQGRLVYWEGLTSEISRKMEHKEDGTVVTTDMISGAVCITDGRNFPNYSKCEYANGRSAEIFHNDNDTYTLVVYDANGVLAFNRTTPNYVYADGSTIFIKSQYSDPKEVIICGMYDMNLLSDGQYFGKAIPGTDDYDVDFAISSEDEVKKS